MTDFNSDTQEIPCSYYEVAELNDLLFNNKRIVVFHENIRSFQQNYDNFSLLLGQIDANVGVIVLTETWFTDGLCCDIDGFVGHHVFRPDRAGGGVSVYIRLELKCDLLHEFTSINDFGEFCVVEVLIGSNNQRDSIVIVGAYRPPNSSIREFSDHIQFVASSLSNKSVMICGDLNVDLMDEDANADFFNSLYSFNFIPLINVATRVTDSSAKCIDHMWFNKLNISFAGAIVADITDHYPVFAVLDSVLGSETVKQTFRNHSARNIDVLCGNVDAVCSDFFVNFLDCDVDFKCQWFVNRLWEVYNCDCPKKTRVVSLKRLLKPWITNDIRRMANQKHRLFKQYKLHRVPFDEYNNYKCNLDKIIKKSKKDYFSMKFNKCRNDVKRTWKIINDILSKSHKKSDNIVLQDVDGVEIGDPFEVANAFCDHFSTIASRLDSNIPMTATDPMDYMPDPVSTTFIPTPASTNEVTKLILSLPDKHCNVNAIPIFIIKKLSSLISPVIVNIFNDCIEKGIFPSVLKSARVIPLYKSKSHKIIDNFRPISLLPLFSKLMEKLMKVRCMEFIQDNNIMYSSQYGFRSGCSTSDAILHLVDNCVAALDKRLYTITVFLDFSKAFDTVNGDIMLLKLDNLGFRGPINSFFRSYLSDRRMYVSVGGRDSTENTVNIGLPQGSVTSPWLFSLYINDLHRTSQKLKFIHFADDTTVYLSGGDLRKLCSDVSDELELIDNWLKANRLSLNIGKTCFMVHTHCSYDSNDCVIKIRGEPVKYVRSTKFLGLILDDKFNFNEHVSNLTKQLSKSKGMLYKLSCYVPPTIVRQLYFSLFYSRMIYGIAVWGGGNRTNVNKVERINESAVRIFNNKLPVEILRPLSFGDVYIYNCSLFFYKFSNNILFSYFNNKINLLIPIHDHSTRFTVSNNYSLPIVSKTVSLNQFLFNAIKIWNNLPVYIRNLQNYLCFKSKLRSYLKHLNLP